MNDHDRRATDPLLRELLEGQAKMHAKLEQMENDMIPMLDFMKKMDGAKTAIYWIIGLLVAIGGIVTWILNVKDHIHRP